MKEIHLWGINQNNLKDVELKIPLGQFTVICGPSGSGKSSLAFDTLFAEGQRRFIESMSNYSKQFLAKAPKPDVEGVNNIPPAVAIEQKNTVKSSRSTVGTTTELLDHLRLLFEKLGKASCHEHKLETQKHSPTSAAQLALQQLSDKKGYLLVEVNEKHRSLTGKKLLQQLVEDGVPRLYIPDGRKKDKIIEGAVFTETTLGNVVEITPAVLKKPLPKKTFYLVVDRLMFKENMQDRLVDSLEQAYELSCRYNTHLPAGQAFFVTTEGEKLKVSDFSTCPVCDYTPPQLSSGLFSFNSPLGACPDCKGFGNQLQIDEAKVVPNPELSINQGALAPFEMPSARADRKELRKFCDSKNIDREKPWNKLSKKHRKMIWEATEDFYGVEGLFEYLETKKYKMHVRVFISRYKSAFTCKSCNGSRLRADTENIKLKGHSLQELSRLSIEKLSDTVNSWEFDDTEKEIVEDPFQQIQTRLKFLRDVGVNYLSIDRETRTLSGGEYQRLILANQLGMGLSQSLYVLDEPTVGLHPRDNDRLIEVLSRLRDIGNTLVVVEHDHDVIRNSDHVVEMGPGSGYLGGEVVFNGPQKDFFEFAQSKTVPYLLGKVERLKGLESKPVDLENYKFPLRIRGCTGNNLKNLDVTFPLNRLVCVTGVSGSGKSSLVSGTLYPAVARTLDLEYKNALPYKKLEGTEELKNVLLIDQSPIGKTARSNPVTYLKIYDAIRQLFADLKESKLRGYKPGTFSLNVDGGRCPVCKGLGFEEVDMVFMDNVRLTCDACDGKKFRSEILEVRFKKKNIFEVLEMTVAEAMDFFVAYPNIRKSLALLREVGLDYIQLGQSAATLSGGESQRLKVAKELSNIKQRNTLYILDEPTTGLHFQEVDLLLQVLHKLVDGGGSVIVVEHNLDVIKSADHVIDLGPEAGQKGGELLFSGSAEAMMRSKKSITGSYLKRYAQPAKKRTRKKSEVSVENRA